MLTTTALHDCDSDAIGVSETWIQTLPYPIQASDLGKVTSVVSLCFLFCEMAVLKGNRKS